VTSVDPLHVPHNRLHRILTYLSTRHEVCILALEDTLRKNDYNGPWKGEALPEGVQLEYLVEGDFPSWTQEILSLGIVRRDVVSSAEVVFVYNSALVGLKVLRFAARRNLTRILDLADDLAAMSADSPFVPRALRPITPMIFSRVLAQSIRLSDIVTCTSSLLANMYRVPEDKRLVLPNGVDTRRFNCRRESLCTQGGTRQLTVAYVGVLREWVDLAPVAHALHRLNAEGYDVRLIVAGGEERLGTYSRKYFRDTWNFVDYRGHVPYDEVPSIINEADACVVPFRHEISLMAPCRSRLQSISLVNVRSSRPHYPRFNPTLASSSFGHIRMKITLPPFEG
jgi:glycosyltransferase involved in cell wall biosynthesis